MFRSRPSFVFALLAAALIGLILSGGTALGGYWVGAEAPELTFDEMVRGPADVDDVKLANLPGKTVVLVFWSINCPSCPTVMPHLNNLAEELSDEPVQIISVVNFPRADVEEFLRTEHELDKSIWIGLDGTDQSITFDYLVMGVPMSVVVNKEGSVAAVTHPLNVTPEVVREVMAGGAPAVEQPPAAEGLLDQELPTQLSIYELVMRSAPQNNQTRFSRVGGLRFWATPLRDMLFQAFGVAPSLIFSDSLILDAKYDGKVIPPQGQEHTARDMLRTMLERSFPLEATKETREIDVWTMSLPSGPGPELRPAADGGDWVFEISDRHLRSKKTPMNYLAYRMAQEYGVHVIDETGDGEIYDFTISWVSMDDDDPKGFKARLAEKLGLVITEEKREMEVLQVERAEPAAQE